MTDQQLINEAIEYYDEFGWDELLTFEQYCEYESETAESEADLYAEQVYERHLDNSEYHEDLWPNGYGKE